MATDLPTRLKEFQTAIENEDIEQARSIYQDILEIYEAQRDEELRLSIQSRVADIESNDDAEAVNEYVGTHLESLTERFQFKAVGGMIVDQYEELQEEGELDELWNDLQTRIDELETLEQELDDRKDTADAVTAETDIPADVDFLYAKPDVTDSLQPGDSFTVETMIANVGDKQADTVDVSIETTSAITIDQTVDSIGTLDGNAEVKRAYNFEVVQDGKGRAQLELDSANAGGDQTTIAVPVSGTDEGTSPLKKYANENGVIDTEGLRDAIDDWRAEEIDTGLLRDVIQAWREKDPIA